MSAKKAVGQSQVAVWDFRANKDLFTEESLKSLLKIIAKKWAFQLERGDGGYEHWQGRFSLIKKRRKKELMHFMEAEGHKIPNYLEPTSKAAMGDAFYVMKKDTRIQGPWTNKDQEKFLGFQHKVDKLYTWQEQVLASADQRDARIINIVVDDVGNKGKSVTAGHARFRGYYTIPVSNDGDKLIQSFMDMIYSKKDRDPKLVIIDLPRAMPKGQLQQTFLAIEMIKTGWVYDCRYSFREWGFHSPQVWVFTNQAPDEAWLSKDRWRYWKIDGEELVSILPPRTVKPLGAFGGAALEKLTKGLTY